MNPAHTFKSLVAAHLQAAADSQALTRQQVAQRLGLQNGNYISMLANPNNPTLLSPTRLPALHKACGLEAEEVVELMWRRVADHPDKPMHLDTEVFVLLARCLVQVVDARRAARGAGERHDH